MYYHIKEKFWYIMMNFHVRQVHTSTEWRSTPYISSHFTLSRNLYSAWPGLIPLENTNTVLVDTKTDTMTNLLEIHVAKWGKKDKVQRSREIQGQIIATQFIFPQPSTLCTVNEVGWKYQEHILKKKKGKKWWWP